MAIRTVKVSNLSLGASEQDIREFFSFSGVIEYVEIKSGNERSQTAFITFKDPEGAETSVLLSGATIVDQSVTIALEPDYVLPPAASAASGKINSDGAISASQKAADVVSSMLAKGFILGKDAVNKAKAFDEKHQFTSTATEKVTTLDQKIGLSEKLATGATIVNDKVKEMDQKFQVSEKTKSVFATAEQTVGNAGSAIMKNRYVLSGASWVSGALSNVAKAAGDVGQKTKEKVAEGSPKVATRENKDTGNVAEVHSSEFLKAAVIETKPSAPKAEVHSSGSPKAAIIETKPSSPKAEIQSSEFLKPAIIETKPSSPKDEVHSSGSPKAAILETKPSFPKAGVHSSGSPKAAILETKPSFPKAEVHSSGSPKAPTSEKNSSHPKA